MKMVRPNGEVTRYTKTHPGSRGHCELGARGVLQARRGAFFFPSGDGGALGSLLVSSEPFASGVVTVGGVGTAFEATSRYDKREANGTAVEVAGRVEVSISLSDTAGVVGARDAGAAVADSTLLVRLCARRPAYGLHFRRDNIIGGGAGISSAHAT